MSEIKTIFGDIVTYGGDNIITDVKSLKVSLEPIQDLRGYDAPWVGGAGKNKLPYPYTNNSGKTNGITYSTTADGRVTISGTATATAWVRLYGGFATDESLKKPVPSWITADTDYVLSGGQSSNFYVQANIYSGTSSIGQWIDTGSGKSFSLTSEQISNADSFAVFIRVNSGQTVNATITPMIEEGSARTSWKPYENICPISGHTDVVVSRTGKNLLPSVTSQIAGSGITATWQTDGTLKLTGTASGNVFVGIQFSIKAGSYVLSGCPSGGGDSTYQLDIRSSVGSGVLYSRDIGSGLSFSPSADLTAYVNIRVANGYACPSGGLIVKPMIRRATDSADFEPFGDTYTTALGTTVYGGTLDVTTGVLPVDRAVVTYDGTEDNWQETTGSGFRQYFITVSGMKNSQTAISDSFQGIALSERSSKTGMVLHTDTYIRFSLLNDFCTANGISNVPTWKTWLSSNNVQVVYPLATPTTVQLTAQQIEALLGVNNLWASAGDVTLKYTENLLMSESVSVNGKYLEAIIDGYLTLGTSGRRSLAKDIETYSVGSADGETVKNSVFPAREITVHYVIQSDTEDALIEAVNQLNNILNQEEVDFVFNDEPDKFFSGFAIMDSEPKKMHLAVKGVFTIYCAYPFKRSVDPTVLSSTDASGVTLGTNSATFTIDYDGTYPARPVLRASFASAKQGGDYSEDGDCGFVAFLDANENIIQLGNPEVIDVDQYAKNETLVNSSFNVLTGWTPTNISSGQITDAYWNNGAGQTQSYAKPSGAATLTRATSGAVNHEFDIVHRLCVSQTAQTGKFEAYAQNNGTIVVGFKIEKTGNGTSGVVSYILNGNVVGTDNIDLSYYNTHFGFCNRTNVYTTQTYQEKVVTYVKKKKKKKKKTTYVTRTRQVFSGYSYTQSNLNSGWTKDGAVVTFSVGNLPDRTFKCSAIELTPSIDIKFGFDGNFDVNAVHSCSFIAKAGVPFAEIPNVFTAGDIVEADCNSANVTLYRDGSAEGHLEPQYGALGNDWEDFELKPGLNVIRAVWSDWVNINYKPLVQIIFNKVYL